MTINPFPVGLHSDGALGPVTPVSLAEQVADRITEAIASGHLASGQRLIENDLALELQVSRVPVREALRVLESQGIVSSVPRRGVRIVEFDAAWASQLYEVRVALERLVTRHAALKIRNQPEAIRAVDQVIERMRMAVNAGDRLALNRTDLAFHQTLCELAQSPLLNTLWAAIARHVLIIFSKETYRHADLRVILDQHLRMRELLIGGDLKKIEDEIPHHIAGNLSLLVERRREASEKTARKMARRQRD